MRKLLFIGILLISHAISAQNRIVRMSGIRLFDTDPLGNVYVLSQTNQLNKYDSTGKWLATLNYSYNGSISSIDVSNPIEIIVFYKELNTLLFLDDNLVFRGELNLANAGIIQAQAVSRSYDNACWIFDAGDFQLKKIRKNGETLIQSGSLPMIITNFNSDIRKMAENASFVFLMKEKGIYVFDIFGNYNKTISYSGNILPSVSMKKLWLPQANSIVEWKSGLPGSENKIFELPNDTILECSLSQNHLYYRTSEGIFIK